MTKENRNMMTNIQTVSIPVDDEFDLILELPETLATRCAEPTEKGVCRGEFEVKGIVPKPPPTVVIGKGRVVTTVKDGTGAEKVLDVSVQILLAARGT